MVRGLRVVHLVELGFIGLIGVPLLLPGKVAPLAWHPYLLLVLLLIGPVGCFSTGLQWVKALTAHGLTHGWRAGWRQWQPATPITALNHALLCILAIGLVISSDQTQSLIVTGYILLGMALYATLLRLPKQIRSAEYLLWLLLTCGTGLAIIAPLVLHWRAESRFISAALIAPLRQFQLNIGETIHPNVLAGAMVIILPFAVALLVQASQQTKRVAFVTYLVMTLVMAVALLLTQSRGGVVAFGCALLVMFVLRHRRLGLLALSGALILGVGAYISGPQRLMEQLSTDGSLGGIEGRITIWQNTLYAITDFPLTGIGVGAFVKVMSLLYPVGTALTVYPHAHNLLLQVGVDTGIPGLIVYLAILLNLVAMLVTILRGALSSSKEYALAIGAAGSLTGLLFHGLLDAVTWGTKIAFLPWLLFALIAQLFLTLSQHPAPASTKRMVTLPRIF